MYIMFHSIYYSTVLFFRMFLLDSLPLFIVTLFVRAATPWEERLVGLSAAACRRQTALSLFCRFVFRLPANMFQSRLTVPECQVPFASPRIVFHLAINIRLFWDPSVKFLTSQLNVCPAYSLTWILLAAKLHVVSLARDVEQKKTTALTPSCLRVKTSGINKATFQREIWELFLSIWGIFERAGCVPNLSALLLCGTCSSRILLNLAVVITFQLFIWLAFL